MAASLASRLERWKTRLDNLPAIALPTDYARPSPEKTVDGRATRALDASTALSLLRLSLHDAEADAPEDHQLERPSPFQLLLAAFIVLLHRFTADADLVVATSSPASVDPLLLRVNLDPQDSFWALVRQVQFLEREAVTDAVPFDALAQTLGRQEASGPLFRVRFFDATDKPHSNFLDSTQLTTDLTVNIASEPATQSVSSHNLHLPALSLRCNYNSLLFSHARIEHIFDQLQLLLSQFANDPSLAIGKASLITPAQQKLLPDPKADLDFCGYRGSITDIFSRNAAQHPQRRCIVESYMPSDPVAAIEDPKQETRTFSYKQVDEASNLLAHYLIKNGVEREDVVTVYSTRNVDLVISVLGIQKAGATFSVIGLYQSLQVAFAPPWLTTHLRDRPCLPTSETADLPQGGSAPRTCGSR